MLQVTFKYEGDQPIYETLRSLQFKYEKDNYILTEKKLNYTATISHDAYNKILNLQFSKELSFEQYKHLHNVIKTIAENLNAEIDDHLALMGYLEDGKEAYIYRGWNKWVRFLESARHVSMEGQKVQVFDNNTLLAEGILIETEKAEFAEDNFQIIQCTVITKAGEVTLTGDNLKIIATGEF